MFGLEVILLFLSILSLAQSDTPANCHFKDIIGKWSLMVGEETRDRPFHCSQSQTFDVKYQIDLIYPNVAVDQYSNVGFWTLVYNQGFEIQIQGLFALAEFDPSRFSFSHLLPITRDRGMKIAVAALMVLIKRPLHTSRQLLFYAIDQDPRRMASSCTKKRVLK